MTVWVRMRSLATGHHFDVPLSALDRYLAHGAEEIPGRRIRAAQPRRAKYLVDLSGRRVAPARPVDQEGVQR